jgi:hypothetical protein
MFATAKNLRLSLTHQVQDMKTYSNTFFYFYYFFKTHTGL